MLLLKIVLININHSTLVEHVIYVLTVVCLFKHTCLRHFKCFSDRCRTAGNLYSQNLCVAVTNKFANLPAPEATEDSGLDVMDYEFEVVVGHEKQNESSARGQSELSPESVKLINSVGSNNNMKRIDANVNNSKFEHFTDEHLKQMGQSFT